MVFKIALYLYGKIAILRITPVEYYFTLNKNMFPWFQFWNILNTFILNTNTYIWIIKFEGHHASKFAIIYSNGSHIGFNYNHTSLGSNEWSNALYMYFNHPSHQIYHQQQATDSSNWEPGHWTIIVIIITSWIFISYTAISLAEHVFTCYIIVERE